MKKSLSRLKKISNQYLSLVLGILLILSVLFSVFIANMYYRLNQEINLINKKVLSSVDQEVNLSNHSNEANSKLNELSQIILNDESVNKIDPTLDDEIASYSAVVTVIDREKPSLLNFEIFNRANNLSLLPKEDWLRISMNDQDSTFKVYCRKSYKLKDCSGGFINRLSNDEYCTREILPDIKNTLSLECALD